MKKPFPPSFVKFVSFVVSASTLNQAGSARATLVALGLLFFGGLALGWNKGQLRRRDQPVIESPAANATAPDLELYSELIAAVRGGANYYDAAHAAIPRYGFPISSPLNWRLPTYAWLFARLPNKCTIQAVLLLLAAGGMCLAFLAIRQQSSLGHAGVTACLLFGVIRWTFDGEAYLAQEVWAAALILISIAAHALARQRKTSGTRQYLSISLAAGLSALFFRELALPYCGIACLLAAGNGRWLEACAWAAGIAAFFGFFAWHIGQVRQQLVGSEMAAAAGLSQWLRYGGLDFVLLTTRMNSLLFAAPPFLLWLYLLAALVGLTRRGDETSQLACLATLTYILAFAFLGRPENFYWGLIPAPLLALGPAFAPERLQALAQEAQFGLAAGNAQTTSSARCTTGPTDHP